MTELLSAKQLKSHTNNYSKVVDGCTLASKFVSHERGESGTCAESDRTSLLTQIVSGTATKLRRNDIVQQKS